VERGKEGDVQGVVAQAPHRLVNRVMDVFDGQHLRKRRLVDRIRHAAAQVALVIPRGVVLVVLGDEAAELGALKVVHKVGHCLKPLADTHVPRAQLVGHGHQRPSDGRHEEV
jgi:hypothetical protein